MGGKLQKWFHIVLITGKNFFLKLFLILTYPSKAAIYILVLGCRAPNPDTVLIIQTPLGVFSAKSLIQNKKKAGSRLISSNRTNSEEVPTVDSTELEPLSAARCRLYKRPKDNKKVPYL